MNNSSNISISTPMIKQTIEGAIKSGFDVHPLLKKSRIDPDVLDHPEARVPVQKFVRLSRYIAGMMKDEF